MKKLLTVITSILISLSSFSQGSYDDLLIIKADGNWDDLIKKSERYTLRGATEKDALPYYYLAFGLYKISFQADRDAKYKNAYKDAFNAIGKMLRNDKSGEVQEKHADFLDELKLSLLEIIQNEVESDEHRRAFGWVMRLYKFGRDYTPVYYLEGALRYRNSDKSTAFVKWKAGDDLLKDDNINNWSEADKKIFMLGLYESAKALKVDRQNSRAKEIMNIGAPYFEKDKRWKSYYDEIVNS